MTYLVCPHDRETFVREKALYSYECPTCEARVCLDCRRHGSAGFMIPLVSWMTGLCGDCYDERSRRGRIRKNYWDSREQRERLSKVWSEGRDAGPDAPDPYATPTYYEVTELERHAWLREEMP